MVPAVKNLFTTRVDSFSYSNIGSTGVIAWHINDSLYLYKFELSSYFEDGFVTLLQPWTNYVSNGNKYLIIGTVARSEYSNIRYLHLIIGDV